MVIANFGLDHPTIKEVSRRQGMVGDYWGPMFCLRLLLAAVVFFALLMYLFLSKFSYEVNLIIALIGAYQILSTLIQGISAVLVGREIMRSVAAIEFSLKVSTAIIGVAVVLLGGDLADSIATMPIVASIQLAVAYRIVSRTCGSPSWRLPLPHIKATLREAAPYATTSFLRQMSTRIDVVLLGYLLGSAAAGTYNVAYRIVFVLTFVPHYASLSLFPLASRLYLRNFEDFRSLYHRSLGILVLAAVPSSAGLWLLSSNVISLLFGSAFAESAAVLRILSWLIILAFLKSTLGAFLMASDRQLILTKSWWWAMWLNLLTNAILIPLIGAVGAAIATLVSDVTLVAFCLYRLRDLLGWPRVGIQLIASFTATTAFCLPFLLLSSVSRWLALPLAALLYPTVLLSFKDIRNGDIRIVIRSLFSRSA